ncbi:DoxX family protein [Novosphingobium percolationis]|uniref:DoxX family protein n=1 Tax=Novosphingobium percolationis TaxID=2871811 RepID=UPI001CD41269|nr:hypothetical protein [Novosphingobium percolationis]
MTGKAITRALLVALYMAAGLLHISRPLPFLTITPGWVPFPEAVIFWTGMAEIVGAGALAQTFSGALRRWGGMGLSLYAVCVFPANIHHFALDMAKPDHGLGLAYHLPRMVVQPVLVWLALWCSGAIDWWWARRNAAGP